MKLFNKLGIAATVVVLGFGVIQTQANAGTLTGNMIINGDFEQVFNDDGELVQGFEALEREGRPWYRGTSVDSVWETTGKDNTYSDDFQVFEMWEQGTLNSPEMGSDDSGTGQHLELNSHASTGEDGIIDNNSPGTTISQTFTIDTDSILSGSALFSFDAWSRKGGTGSVKIVRLLDDGTEEALLLDGEETQDITANGDSWTRKENTWTVKGISAGDQLKVSFMAAQDNSSKTLHIDDVSFRAKEVPEPTSMLGILAVGAFGTVSNLKRKKQKEIRLMSELPHA